MIYTVTLKGCPSGRPGKFCHLGSEAGPCTNYSVKWFYDAEYGGCNRFWFGGCGEGKNHFEDEESCKQVITTLLQDLGVFPRVYLFESDKIG